MSSGRVARAKITKLRNLVESMTVHRSPHIQKRFFSLESNEDAVPAAESWDERLVIHFNAKFLEKVHENHSFSILPHMVTAKLANEMFRRLDHIRVLSNSISRKCWIFVAGNLKFSKN